MRTYLVLLIASVFLGTELFAISTPLVQVSLYRLLVFGAMAIFAVQIYKQDASLKLLPRTNSTLIVGIYLFWWLWGLISVLWVVDLGNWFQAMFLLTLGVASIVSLYLWTLDERHWRQLLTVTWWMMTLLALWGLYEITFNHYIFADLTNLDPHDMFANNPLTRIPITTFTNQNDYATLLLAYLPVNLIKFHFSHKGRLRYGYLITVFLATFLIYRSESRMILLSLGLFFAIYCLLQFKWDLSGKKLLRWGLILTIVVLVLVLFIPPLRERVEQLFYVAGDLANTGDSRRINLWRNGLIFLAKTFGLGVGAGNIEAWMAMEPFLLTDNFYNIHNWWLEVLVGYGLIVFLLYLIAYGLMFYTLFKIRQQASRRVRQIANSFMAFLVVFIFASITSANNMLIEWHWVFFGLLISFLKLCEGNYSTRLNRMGWVNEFNDNNQ